MNVITLPFSLLGRVTWHVASTMYKIGTKLHGGGVGEQRIQISISGEWWDKGTRNDVQLQEVDQYDRKCPEIVGGNTNERDGWERNTHTDEGPIVQSSQKDARHPKLRAES